MLTVWKSLVQSKLDYCSQLWSPSDQASIGKLESVARNFTSQIHGMEGLDYWERLHSLHLYSQERRRERYQIIFLWKVAQGLVKGYQATFTQSERRGRLMTVALLCNQSPAAVKKARESRSRWDGYTPAYLRGHNPFPTMFLTTLNGQMNIQGVVIHLYSAVILLLSDDIVMLLHIYRL